MNSRLVSVDIPASQSNFTDGRSGRNIRKITVHHCAGIMSAESIGYLWQNPGRECSSHYGIGNDGRIGQYVDEYDTAWTDSNWESNCSSVTIETSNDSTGGEWHVGDSALNSLIQLCADISIRNGLGNLVPGQNLTWHSMYAATACPGDYLRSKMQYIADEANKIIGGGPTPTPTPTNKISEIQQWLNNNYGTNLNIDGIYGPATECGLVKAWQHEHNVQFGAGLVEDGIYGPACREASCNCYIGCEGNITKIIQCTLCCIGYSLETDGIYGNDTFNNVSRFQASQGLTIDGITGADTFDRLFSQA